MVYEDLSSYNGDWQKNLRHGQGELVKADGSMYRGLWAEDMYHGRGTLYIPMTNYTYSGTLQLRLLLVESLCSVNVQSCDNHRTAAWLLHATVYSHVTVTGLQRGYCMLQCIVM